jgi:vancomycin resistance protein VanJ
MTIQSLYRWFLSLSPQIVKRWLWRVSWAYALGLNLYLLLYLAVGMTWPVVAQLIHIAHWLTALGGITGAILAAYPSRRAWALLGLPGLIAFGLWYGPYFNPIHPTPAQADNALALTLATYNIRDNTIRDNAEVGHILGGMGADVVALQEVSPSQVRYLRADFAALYPYQAAYMTQRFDILMILSRYPILETSLPAQRDYTQPSMATPRFMRVVIQVGGQPLAVYNFHPMRPQFKLALRYDDQLNRQNYDQLLEALAQEGWPHVVLCDCNASPLTAQYDWLARSLDDLHRQVGWGLGLTHTGLPMLPFRNTRIDYIWYSAGLRPLAVQVWGENGHSDHSPVRGQLSLIGAGQSVR